MDLLLIGLCLCIVIILYFLNNPLNHGRWYVTRRFFNWLPLGMTYAFLYMGRYNLNVSKHALGSLMSNSDFGLIFGIGTGVYGCSFLINGPLVDKIGGKKGILIAAIGASIANALMGVVTYLFLLGKVHFKLLPVFCVLYALNMFFQSYGGVSIIKVKAYWFHVRERGVFGAIFGTLISFGVYFAFDWGSAIVNAVKGYTAGVPNTLGKVLGYIFAVPGSNVAPLWAVFFVPAILLVGWILIDIPLIRNKPEDAGFPPLDTADASSDENDKHFEVGHLLKKFFTNPIMILICLIELTAGVVRNGIMQWYPLFAREVYPVEGKFFVENWGILLCFAGIFGSFAAGAVSDRLFQSRRGPTAALSGAMIVVFLGTMLMFLSTSALVISICCILISALVIGIHGSMSGTAAADFGGKENTGTASGITDGFVYLGSSIQSIAIGYLSARSWTYWPMVILPFAAVGLYFCIRMWKKLPNATVRYLHNVEHVDADVDGINVPTTIN
jgi:OPA family glycerol-3-phosphate transporter-like MFS transporter